MVTETVYVDPVLGNDGTGTVDDPSLPFEHIQAAVDALTIGSDGIAILAAGIYIEDSGGTNYCDLTRSLASLTIISAIDYGATIRAAVIGGQARVINATAPLTIFTLGKVTIDAENDQAAHVTFDTAAAMQAVVDGSRFINCNTIVFDSTDHLTSFIMQNDWLVVDAPAVIDSSVAEADTSIDISNGIIVNNSTSFSRAPIDFSGTSLGLGLDIVIDGVRIDYTCSSTATGHKYGIRLHSIDTISIKNCVFLFDNNGSAANASACLILPDITIVTSSVIIEHNLFGDDKLSTIVGGIAVGVAVELTRDNIDNVVVRYNEIVNVETGLLFRYITGAKSYANLIKNVGIGCLALATRTCEHTCNLIIDASEQSLLAQFDTDSIIGNNTCVALSLSPDGHFYSTYYLVQGVGDSHGTLFVNNIVLDFIGEGNIIFCENDSTAKYKNNDIFQPNNNTVNRFYYRGITTDSLNTLSVLVNALDPGGMSGNLEINPEFDPHKEYELLSTSPLIGAGLKWWADQDSNPVGVNGNSFWDAFVDLGANSTWDSAARRAPSPERLASPGRSTSYRTPYIP